MRYSKSAAILMAATLFACSDLTPTDVPSASRAIQPTEHPVAATSATTVTHVADRPFSSKAASSTDTAGAEGWSTIESWYSAFRIVSDAAAPRSPASVAQVSFSSGLRGGSVRANATKPFPDSGYRELALSVWTRLSGNWAGPRNGTTILGELTVGGQVGIRLVAEGVGSNPLHPVLSLGAGLPDARTRLAANVDAESEISRVGWQRWDVEVRLNAPGRADGHVEWSLDGRVIGRYDDVEFVGIGDTGVFDAYRQRTIWGSSWDIVPTSMWVRYDHVIIDAKGQSDDASIPVDSTNRLVRECGSPGGGWLFCDDFETNRLGSYFEYDDANSSFTRTSGVGLDGSAGMRAHWNAGQVNAGALRLAFGRTPDPYMRPVDGGTASYRELYWRVFLKNQSGWTGGSADKLSRAIVFANANWAEAAIAHVWGADAPYGNYLALDPASGTDAAGNLKSTQYNDFANFRWLGSARSQTPLFDAAHVGSWYCVEAHVRLNDAGQSNGTFELWIDGALEAQRTGLNWLGSFSAYGLNALFFENYWNNGAPQAEERYFDNLVVSTQPIGCGAGSAPPPPPPPPAPTLTAVELTPSSASLLTGATQQFSATGRMSDGSTTPVTIAWSATGGTISSSGGYTAGSTAGTFRVIARQSGGTLADTATVTIAAPAPAPVASVTVQLNAATLTVGQTTQATAVTRDADGNVLTGRSITWASTNAGVATVSSSGLVTAVAAGSASIRATSEGVTGAATLTVTAPAPTLTAVELTPSSASLLTGATQQFSATGRMSDGSTQAVTVTYAATGGTITSGGLYTAGSTAGSYRVIARQSGGTLADTATVTVTAPAPAPVASVTVSPSSASVTVGGTTQLTATLRDASGTVLTGRSISWASSNATVATVNGTGLVSGATAGTATITATSEGKTGSATVTVTAPSTAVTGLDFLGNADGRSTLFAWNLSRTGVAPMAKFPATFIWRAYPRSGQLGYWSSLFHASWQGPNTFDAKYFYYGAHPYPWEPVAWEISAGSNDQPEDPSQRVPVVFNRWYTQVVTVDANAKITFYYDWDAGRSFSYQDEDRPQPDPALIVGDAPWNPGHEIYYGILRGFQYYDALLTPAQIAQELASPGAARRPWYLNLNPTPDDIADRSGSGHDPKWMTSNRPRLWTQP
jgi:uncharacterized protein YjdB